MENKPSVKQKVDILKDMLNAPSVNEQFENALKENRSSFVASLIDLYNGDEELQLCEPKAVIMEALKAATLKLPINKALGFAYIVVFKNSVKQPDGSWIKVATPTFMPGYKGYIQLAMRTGQYRYLNADMVYEGELKKVDKLTGEIDFSGEKTSDKVIGYFCHFELLNGFRKTLYVPLQNMAKHAKKYSPSLKDTKDRSTTVDDLIKLANTEVNSKSVGWLGNFNQMAIKTVVRNLLSDYGYLSVEMQNVVVSDREDAEETRNKAVEKMEPKRMNIEDVPYTEENAQPTEAQPTNEPEVNNENPPY